MSTEDRRAPGSDGGADAHGPDPDMDHVIEGPVGSASIVDPETIPAREGRMPELGLAEQVPPRETTPEP